MSNLNDDKSGCSSSSSATATAVIETEQQPQQLEAKEEAMQNDDSSSPPTALVQKILMNKGDLTTELNLALESLDTMRRANLDIEFSCFCSNVAEKLPPCLTVNHEMCTYCQREAWERFRLSPTSGNGSAIGSSRTKRFDGSRIRKLRSNVGSFFVKTPSDDNQEKEDGDAIRKEDDELFAAANGYIIMGDAYDDDVHSSATANEECNVVLTSDRNGENGINRNNKNSNSSDNKNSSLTKSTTPRKKFLQKSHHPCLTCGHPICSGHQSSTFTKSSSIRICQQCANLFELDFLVDIIVTTASSSSTTTTLSSNNNAECQKKVNEMVDCYDRAKLLLSFTAQYTDDIAKALEHSTARSNKIGVGSSATSLVSGVAGVVGCGVLLFPPVAAVGVPILISSLVFGGAATAAQTADWTAAQYFSEPNKLADKMVLLHSMMLSLLRISEVLSVGLLNREQQHADDLECGDDSDRRRVLKDEINVLLEKHGITTKKGVKGLRAAMVGGAVAAETAVAGASAAEISATSLASTGATVAGRSSRFFGRVGTTTAATSARFIPIAGGLLSAASIVVEGKELKRTLSKINEGNPCAKAEQIRLIRDEMVKFPDSSAIAEECRRVFELVAKERTFF